MFFSITAAGDILGRFWDHSGLILVALWSLWVPFGFRLSSLLHLGGTLVALCALWWCPLGFFSVPSGILVAFSLDFVAFSMDFKRMFLCFHGLRILLCLAVTGGIPNFFK